MQVKSKSWIRYSMDQSMDDPVQSPVIVVAKALTVLHRFRVLLLILLSCSYSNHNMI